MIKRLNVGGKEIAAKTALALIICGATPGYAAENPSVSALAAQGDRSVILPEPIPDPLEPINRGLSVMNKALMIGIIKPTAKVYRAVTCPPLRDGIKRVGKNIGYPTRVVNNMLQGKWAGARDETYRVLCNTVLGVGGFWDVAERFDIEPSPADFGQTFGVWGWRPRVYLMLPLMGPSNERDALGSFGDRMVNPLSYFEPWSYIPLGITYNNLTDDVENFIRLSEQDYDPYFVLRHAWTIRREAREVDVSLEGPQHQPSLETLKSVFFGFKDPDFPEDGDRKTVVIDGTGRKLPYNVWMQRGPAPLVYVIPGLGSHRSSSGALGLAELLFNEGYSVAVVSSAFNYEFMEAASTAAVPGYTPVDVEDMHRALTAVDARITRENHGRITQRALMGYSMGGFHALQMAARAEGNSEAVHFDRFVAINPPVSLAHSISVLDGYFNAALDWPAEERTEMISRTLLKVGELSKRMDSLSEDSVIPFNETESKFLIGLAFRLHLREIIFSSQMRNNQGVLDQPIQRWRREPAYREILQFSFGEYLEEFVAPYYQGRQVDLADKEQFTQSVDLRAQSPGLSKRGDVRVIHNENDILLAENDIEWLKATFPEDNELTLFPSGGHMGNWTAPEFQRAILQALSDLPLR